MGDYMTAALNKSKSSQKQRRASVAEAIGLEDMTDLSSVPSIDGEAAPGLLLDWAMGSGEELPQAEKVAPETHHIPPVRLKCTLPKVWGPWVTARF